MQFQASPVFHLPLRSGNLMKWILTWNIRQNSSFHSMLLNGVSNEYSQTQPDVLILFFIYLLPKKKKMFYHKSHWNVLLKKKKYIYIFFSSFFHFFFHFFVFFFVFRKHFFFHCFHYIPPKNKNSFFRTRASAAAVSRQPFSPALKKKRKKNAQRNT